MHTLYNSIDFWPDVWLAKLVFKRMGDAPGVQSGETEKYWLTHLYKYKNDRGFRSQLVQEK